MGETTGISWAGATWNPWMGCTKVSAGCDHCYMFREQRQYGNDPEQVRRSKTKFDLPLRLKAPSVIFTCSWSDWFHADADQWRDEAWDIVRRTPQHTYLILTKRHGRIARHLPDDWAGGYPNVWLGVSVEDDAWLRRVDVLREVPAAHRFISAEPLLGPAPRNSWCSHDGLPAPQGTRVNARRLSGHCLYCGARLRHGRKLACAAHGDLPEQDPHWRQAARRPLQAPPDLPVLILTKAAA